MRPRPTQQLAGDVAATVASLKLPSNQSDVESVASSVASAISHTSPTSSIISGKNDFHYSSLFAPGTSNHFF